MHAALRSVPLPQRCFLATPNLELEAAAQARGAPRRELSALPLPRKTQLATQICQRSPDRRVDFLGLDLLGDRSQNSLFILIELAIALGNIDQFAKLVGIQFAVIGKANGSN